MAYCTHEIRTNTNKKELTAFSMESTQTKLLVPFL